MSEVSVRRNRLCNLATFGTGRRKKQKKKKKETEKKKKKKKMKQKKKTHKRKKKKNQKKKKKKKKTKKKEKTRKKDQEDLTNKGICVSANVHSLPSDTFLLQLQHPSPFLRPSCEGRRHVGSH